MFYFNIKNQYYGNASEPKAKKCTLIVGKVE